MRELIIEGDRSSNSAYGDAPESVRELLASAALNWENTAESEKYIQAARDAAPDSLDVSIGAYRYFFYKQQYSCALEVAESIVERVTKIEKLPNNWESLKPILIKRKNNDPAIRLYLNAYLACGFVLAKLQQFERAYQIFKKLKEVDNLNEFGSKIMLDILENSNEDED